MFAIDSGATLPKKAKSDQQIQQIEQSGSQDGTVSVIIRADGTADWASLLSALRAHGVTVGRIAPRTNAIALTISTSDLAWLETLPGVASISIDAPVTSSPLSAEGLLTNTGTGLIKKSDLRALLGLTDIDPTGSGIGVAIIDSGIAPVSDLSSRIAAFYDFTDGKPGVATAPVDGYGHGTHVAGLVGGSGALSGGQYAGVAPNARLIGLRVLNNFGNGSTSDVVAAINFAIANKSALGIDILNLSLGHPVFEAAATDPLVQAVEAASRAGLLVVVSAGNVGVNQVTGQVGYAGILVPGNAPSAFTVASAKTQGTVTPSDDLIANYSSRGPSWIDGFAKPDFAAPGQDLVAPAAPGSYLATMYPSLRVTDNFGNKSYFVLSGTSMAAGVESGLLAVVLEGSRGVTGSSSRITRNALKAFTEYTAFTMHDANGTVYDGLTQGAGRVNGQGLLKLVKSINTTVPVGSPWLTTSVVPYSTYAGVLVPWTQNIVWGESALRRRAAGEKVSQ